jgi:hypothetical protein
MRRFAAPFRGAAPGGLWLLLALYTAASLTHFVHNAEFMALYPNLPAWITRETVYLSWLGIASVGGAGLVLVSAGWAASGLGLLAGYGALGIDGLFHYRYAPCAAHTLTANLSIWAEAITGTLALLACAFTVVRTWIGSKPARST